MKDYYVNLTGVWSREELHSRLVSGLYLPAGYGRNLDALFDLMTEFRGSVYLYGTRDVGEGIEEYVRDMCRAMKEAAAENPLFNLYVKS